MRTRRSPRNQEILFRQLFAPARTSPGTAAAPSVEHVPRCWDCRHYPKGGRNRGKCALRGEHVNGRSERQACFAARPRTV